MSARRRRDEPADSVIEAAKRGDEAAMTLLFRLVNPDLLRFLRAREPRHADDLAGDTWIGIATNLQRFDGDLGGFRAWAFTIARRRLLDHRRRTMRRSSEATDPSSLTTIEDRLRPDQLVLDGLAQTEAVRLVTEHLSDEQAEVVLLRVLGDLSPDEVAEVVGRTPGWVRVTTHRALRKLADRIGSPVDVTQ